MNAKAKDILVSVAFCLAGGLLAVNPISASFAAHTDSVNGEQVSAGAERFAGNSNYCNAFTGSQNVGSDGVSAEFSAALGDAIQANGGDVKRTFSTIRAKCAPLA